MKAALRGQRLIPAAGFALLAFMSGCATPDKITLLPDPDGKVGTVVVRSAKETKVIDKAYASVDVSQSGAIEETSASASDVEARYGSLLAAQPPRPVTFTINFVFDSATELAPGSAATVDKLKATLASWPAPHLTVVGHTDAAGSDEYNDALSMQRAKSVAAFLIKSGIPARQIGTAGRGRRELLVHTPEGVPNQKNRRVVITIQ